MAVVLEDEVEEEEEDVATDDGRIRIALEEVLRSQVGFAVAVAVAVSMITEAVALT